MAQHITTGSGAPSAAPTRIGVHYIDTTNGAEYISVDTSSVNDWILRGSGSGGGSPHPATRSYVVDYSKDSNLANMRDHVLESQDGGANWNRIDEGHASTTGWTGRLTGNSPQFEASSDSAGSMMVVWGDQQLGGTAGRSNVAAFNRLKTAGSRWSSIANQEDHASNSGLSTKGTEVDNSFACLAHLGGTSYAVLVHESGTNNYLRKTTDGGDNWTNQVISGTLLTDLETAGYYVCEHGLWYAHGTLWAALQQSSGPIHIYKSTDGGATWTTFYSTPNACDWANSGSPTYGQGRGVVVCPTLGFYVIGTDSVTFKHTVYRFTDAVSAPTVVTLDGAQLGGFTAFSLASQNGHGYSIQDAGAGSEVFFTCGTLDGNISQTYVAYTTDGATFVEGTYSGGGGSPNNPYGLAGYDGFAWVDGEDAASAVAYTKNQNGGFAHSHGLLNLIGRLDGSSSGMADFLDPNELTDARSSMGIVDNA